MIHTIYCLAHSMSSWYELGLPHLTVHDSANHKKTSQVSACEVELMLNIFYIR